LSLNKQLSQSCLLLSYWFYWQNIKRSRCLEFTLVTISP